MHVVVAKVNAIDNIHPYECVTVHTHHAQICTREQSYQTSCLGMVRIRAQCVSVSVSEPVEWEVTSEEVR